MRQCWAVYMSWVEKDCEVKVSRWRTFLWLRSRAGIRSQQKARITEKCFPASKQKSVDEGRNIQQPGWWWRKSRDFLGVRVLRDKLSFGLDWTSKLNVVLMQVFAPEEGGDGDMNIHYANRATYISDNMGQKLVSSRLSYFRLSTLVVRAALARGKIPSGARKHCTLTDLEPALLEHEKSSRRSCDSMRRLAIIKFHHHRHFLFAHRFIIAAALNYAACARNSENVSVEIAMTQIRRIRDLFLFTFNARAFFCCASRKSFCYSWLDLSKPFRSARSFRWCGGDCGGDFGALWQPNLSFASFVTAIIIVQSCVRVQHQLLESSSLPHPTNSMKKYETKKSAERVGPFCNLKDFSVSEPRSRVVFTLCPRFPPRYLLECRANVSLRIRRSKMANEKRRFHLDVDGLPQFGHWTHRLFFASATTPARDAMNYLVDSPACQNFNFLWKERKEGEKSVGWLVEWSEWNAINAADSSCAEFSVSNFMQQMRFHPILIPSSLSAIR